MIVVGMTKEKEEAVDYDEGRDSGRVYEELEEKERDGEWEELCKKKASVFSH